MKNLTRNETNLCENSGKQSSTQGVKHYADQLKPIIYEDLI